MKASILILFLSLMMSFSAYAEDQITCIAPDLSNDSQLLELMSFVKNDVLGTVPQFCREGEAKQLAEQNDSGEKELSDFVSKLKKLNPNSPDLTSVDLGNDEATKKVIFDTMKMIVLKKMWQQSSADNQYSLLVSYECGDLGLNRFPIYGRSKKSEEIVEKNKEGALKKTLGVCTSTEFKDIAPYLTKDVIAESLLNLKNVFPKSFPGLVDSLCSDLASTDELIFKDDSYGDFSRGKLTIDSAKGFSSWLKSIYVDISNKDQIQKKEMEEAQIMQKAAQEAYALQQKKYEEAMAAKKAQLKEEKESANAETKGPYDDNEGQYEGNEGQYGNADEDEYYKKAQLALKAKFDKYSKDGKIAVIGEDDPEGYAGYEIKNEMGEYFVQPGEAMIKAQKAQYEKQMAEYKKQQEIEVKNFIDKKKNSMKDKYEKGLAKNKKLNEVEDPETPGFVIAKASDGSLYYKPTAETMKALAEADKQFEVQIKDPQWQSYYKEIYLAQQKSDGGTPVSMGYYAGDAKIILDKDGLYKPDPNEKDILSEHNEKISKGLNGNVKVEAVPGQMKGIAIFKSSALGVYKEVTVVEPEMQGAMMAVGYYGNGAYVKPKDVSLAINSYVVKKYQGKTADTSKVKDLKAEEINAIQSYTGNTYVAINTCLRKENCTAEQTETVKAIVSGMQKIKGKNWDGGIEKASPDDYQILFRGTKQIPDFVQENLDKESDSFVLDKGFMSTTGTVSVAKGFSGGSPGGGSAIFIMKTKSCIGIAAMSHFNAEDEFLCPPGMKFKAKKKQGSEGVYILEELSE